MLLFSTHDAMRCLDPTKDRSSAFREDNKDQIYLALNVYGGILEDLEIPLGLRLEIKHRMLVAGICQYVNDCGSYADMVLEGLAETALPGTHDAYKWLSNSSQIPGTTSIARALDFICTRATSHADAVGRVLQFLLFFERFTFNGDSATDELAFKKFKAVNKQCRLYDTYMTPWPGHTLCLFAMSELERIYTAKHWKFSSDDSHFSSGTTTDVVGRSLIGKLKALARTRPNLFGCLYYPLEGGCFGTRQGVRYPRLLAVPKKLDSRRVIAPEDTALAYVAQAALEALRRMLTKNGTAAFINEHDQSINNSLAREGSLTGYWATIDMSSASDSISRSLFFYCLPMAFREMYLEYMSGAVLVPKNKGYETVTLNTLLTSGNPLTWLTEACWFLALGRVGCRLAGVKGYTHKVFSYGDDLIVPSCAYETVCEVLEAFGHTVNRRKSYGAGVFRESCGGWYYHGIDVTPTFWPRRAVSSDLPDILECACSLQHNLFSHGYFQGAQVCAEIACSLYPKLTRSEVNSIHQDLWDPLVDEYTSEKYAHTQFYTEWVAKVSALQDLTNVRLYEMYVYVEYLREGPFYESKLDELLGTSSSRYKPLEAFGIPRKRMK